MVIQNTHEIRKIIGVTAFLMLIFVVFILSPFTTKAATPINQNTDFQIDVGETLTVAVTTPNTWASGNLTYDPTLERWVSDFLRNAVTLDVSTNNNNGFTASMTSDSTTSAALINTATSISNDTIPTLANATTWTRSNTTNTLFWGYSLDDNNESGTYRGLPLKGGTPVTVLSSNTSSAGSQTIYFGAKADSTVASGVYEGAVVISVVSDVITTPSDNPNDNPVIPTNPATPSDAEPTNPSYNPTHNRTVYNAPSVVNGENETVTDTTVVSRGDTRTIYANPQGVTRINEGTPLATGLAVTAGVATTTGIFFFILAKRRKEDDEEEDE